MWFVLFLLVAADAATLGRRPIDIPVEIVYDYPGKSLDVPVARENLQITQEKIIINDKVHEVNTEFKEKYYVTKDDEKRGEKIVSAEVKAEINRIIQEEDKLRNELKHSTIETNPAVVTEVEIKEINKPLVTPVENVVEDEKPVVVRDEEVKEKLTTEKKNSDGLDELIKEYYEQEKEVINDEIVRQVPLVPVVETVVIQENIPLVRELVDPVVVETVDKTENNKEVKKEPVVNEEPQLREIQHEPAVENVVKVVQKEEPEEKQPAPKQSVRNLDAKIQLSPEEVVEAKVLNIPEKVARFQEKVKEQAEENIKKEIKQATSDESQESEENSKESNEDSSEESGEEPDKKKVPEVVLVNDQLDNDKTVDVVVEDIPDRKVIPQVVQQVLQDVVQPVVQDVVEQVPAQDVVQQVQEEVVEPVKIVPVVPDVVQDVLVVPEVVQDAPVVPEVVQDVPVVPEVVQDVPVVPEVVQPAEEIVVNPVVTVVQEVVQDAVQPVSDEVSKENVPVPVKENDPEIKFEEIEKPSISSDSQVIEHVQDIVQQKVQEQADDKVEVVPEVAQIVEEKLEEKTVEVALDEKVSPQEVEKQEDRIEVKEPEKEKNKEEKKTETPKEQLQEIQKDEPTVEGVQAREEVQADEAAPAKPTEGPLGGILNQLGQIFRPNQPNKKPEDEAAESSQPSWFGTFSQNVNNQLSSFNNSFNEFVSNLRPTEKPGTQSDEQPAPAPTPFIDGILSSFNTNFQGFQDNVNNVLTNTNNFLSSNNNPNVQSDEAPQTNPALAGLQTAAQAFNQNVQNIFSTFQGGQQNKPNDEAASNNQNNILQSISTAFESGIQNLAGVFNQNTQQNQNDEASQTNQNPLQSLQNVVSSAGQQIQSFFTGQQNQVQAQPAAPIPAAPPAASDQTPVQQLQNQAEQVQQGITNLVDNIPKPELPQNLPKPELPQNLPIPALPQNLPKPELPQNLPVPAVPQNLPVPSQIQEGISNIVKPSKSQA